MSMVAESGSASRPTSVNGRRQGLAPQRPPKVAEAQNRTGPTVSHRTLITLLVAVAMLIGLTVAAQQAEATTLFNCSLPNTLYATCTRVVGPVTIYDRTDHVNRTWQTGTSVVLTTKYAYDTLGYCGTHGDHWVWAVGWYASGHKHWAVLGDTWLQTGSVPEWMPHKADTLGNTFSDYPYTRLVNTSAYCNSGFWDLYLDPSPQI